MTGLLRTAWSQTLTGRAQRFDAPVITREHIVGEIAHALAITNRFAGQTPVPFSVAQHSTVMADAVLAETGDHEMAAFCLLHDAHEAYLGDFTAPAFAALREEMTAMAEAGGVPEPLAASRAQHMKAAWAGLKRRFDRAIITAADLSAARFEAAKDEIRRFDLRALRTERDDLMLSPPAPWDLIEDLPRLRTHGRLRPVAWPKAEEQFLAAFERLCPPPPHCAAG